MKPSIGTSGCSYEEVRASKDSAINALDRDTVGATR